MNKQERYELFTAPGAEWRAKPFWSWNGELREDEVRRQIGVMQEMGLGGYFMHSRAGLITEYLGDEWFDLINAGADEGEKRGMEAWLYDEDRWPSGSAGGKVTVDPQYRMKSIYIYEQAPETFVRDDDMIAVFAAKLDGIDLWGYFPVPVGESLSDVIAAHKEEFSAKPGVWRALSFKIVPDAPNSNYNGTTYIDTMSRRATDRFIELTHEEYKKRCGERLGTSIKGIFTDEPHRGHAMDNRREENGVISCAMCWTDDLFEEFSARYGYDAKAVLPELFYRPEGDRFAPVKHDWFDLADNLFLERFAKPINDWCEENGIMFTGHVLHEDSLTNQSVPQGSLQRFYEYMGAPGIDILSEGNRCYWAAKQLSSSARQLGKKWLLSELYGCTGWQMSMKGHKAVGDWQALFGINLRCPHLSWYTMEGESKRDYPASILHQSPWYPYYGTVEDYFARFGVFMTEGKPICDVLVVNPIESVWSQSYLGWANWISPTGSDVQKLEGIYAQTFHMLTDNHIDFDYGDEQMMEQHHTFSRDEDGTPLLCIGNQSYRVVVITGMETIRPTTLAILKTFTDMGGRVIFAGDLPAYINASADDAPAAFANESCICVPFEEDALVSAVKMFSQNPVSVVRESGSAAKDIFVQMRNYKDGTAGFVLLNTNREADSGTLNVKIASSVPLSVEQWNFEDGSRLDADGLCTYADGVLSIHTSLPAAGTAAFVLTSEKDGTLTPVPAAMTPGDTLRIHGRFAYELNEPNVCVLDFARFRFNDGAWSEEKEILKIDQMVRDTVGIERRGGEMLQPWYAKLHDKQVYGKVEVEYTFDIDEIPADDVILAGERPELMHYSVNGVPVTNTDINDFWIDDCFKKMPVPKSALKKGRNTVTLTCDFMRTTNLEALYLIGDFGVRIDGHTRTLTTLPATIANENLENANLPFYTGEVTYLLTPEMYADMLNPDDGARILLSPEAFTGSLVRITADGMDEIRLCWDPYEADVTEVVRAKKTIRVTVVGTRRNVFGPLHLVPAIHGAYGPGHFVTGGDAWSDDYVLIDSALTGILLKKYK
ncbi:MAG: hypothetical protein IJ449_05890 [Clostridia bacterium]|nr:hypothetical protein [Clostridia bacterium]